MERNEALFEKIAAQIEETPHLWDQEIFADARECGTAMCVAGWSTYFTCGLEFVPELAGSLSHFRPSNGKAFMEHGQEALGITYEEAMDLFFGPWDKKFKDDVAGAAEFLRAIGRGARFDGDGELEHMG